MRRSGQTKAYRRMHWGGDHIAQKFPGDAVRNCGHFSILSTFLAYSLHPVAYGLEPCVSGLSHRYVSGEIGVSFCMVCPSCNSTDLKRVSLIYAAGVHESRGSLRGLVFGDGDGLPFGRWRGRSQSLLSRRMAPPRKAPYLAPALAWLLGFFILVAFAGRGKLSWLIGVLSAAYALLLPTYLLASLFYNFFVEIKRPIGTFVHPQFSSGRPRARLRNPSPVPKESAMDR
jgi:hypothetical protein